MAGTNEESDLMDDEEDIFSDEEGGMRVDGIYIPPPQKPHCSVDAKGPRLMITKIENHFFKSYAGTETVGPFHKCFNAIVGPNGSGKSNVIDSMLFVFGYRGGKIRVKKLSVLLHNSELYKGITSCTVSVHFQLILDKEGDNYEVIPGSEFIVSRTVLKDSSTFYQLNRKKATLKEIAILLSGHGIDLQHNRFLILQGEVEQIAMMKCKGANENETGMLEYLEDIIGTTRFKKPLVQLEQRVEIISEQRCEKVNRLRLIENGLNEMQGPMQEAIQFLELENTITENKNILYQKKIYDLDKQILEEEASKLLVEEAHNETKNKLVSLKADMSSKASLLTTQSQKYNSLEQRKDTMKAAFDKANNKDIKLQAEMTQVNKTRKTTKVLLAEEKKKLESYKGLPSQNEKEIKECETRIEQLSVKHTNLEKEKGELLLSLRGETQELQEKKEALQINLRGLKTAEDETKSAYDLAESEYKIYTGNEENEKEKLVALKVTYDNATASLKQREEEISKLKTTVPLTEKSLQNANEELLAVKRQEEKLIDEINRRRAVVEETKSSMMASRSRGRVLDSLIQQRSEGKCPGLFGRLGDLGAIDQKYDVAISTACGPLDNIVVDTVSTAQWCIEFLKQYDIGRATFIALEKQEHLRRYAQAEIQTPENVPRLFDLIRVDDERVKTAFYYALRDTLVAENLDQASRIAYGAQRFRVVTLKGDLIETTGTMSGGGRQVSRGRMGQCVTATQVQPQDMDGMERDLQNMEQELRELRRKQSLLQNQISALEPELRQMKINLQKYTIEIQSFKQQVPLLKKQLEEQTQKSKVTKADPKTVKKLSAVMQTKKDAYDAAVADASEIQAQVDEYTKEIKNKTTGKMKVTDKNIDDVVKLIDKCKAEVTRLNVGVKTAERNAVKSTEKISTMEKDIVNAENSLRSMKSQRDEIEEDAKKLLLCIQEITQQLTDGEDSHSGLKEEVASLRKLENEIKSESIEVVQKLKTIKEKLLDSKNRSQQWKTKLQHLKFEDIPNQASKELKTYTTDELANKDMQNIKRELNANEELVKSMKPNLTAIENYSKQRKLFVQRSEELQELTDKRTKMKDLYESLRLRRKEEFMQGYNIIKVKLKEMYQMITLGGDADFELIDTYDPFSEGVQFNVRPPKKSWKIISNLSGGEKTLSSLALVFALHYYKPSPLYVMDEIDAALDFKNVSIVGNYIKERTKNAQFIIISLRSNMFELCDYLTGVYKTFNCTKTITIDPRIYGKQQENTNEAT